MEHLQLTIPSLYGDHHSTAVRGILGELKGVTEIWVSPSFHQVDLDYDPDLITPEEVGDALASHGYLQQEELGSYAVSPAKRSTVHTKAVVAAGDSLVFHDSLPPHPDRPLWPCPGLEYRPLPQTDEAE